MKRVLIGLLFALGLAVPSWAQGIRYDNVAFTLNAMGETIPASGAQIDVCAASDTALPCTNHVAIYSNLAITQQITQPFFADLYGNYGFFTSGCGPYALTITGSTVLPKSYQINLCGNGGAIAPSSLDNIVFVDGVTYPLTCAGIQSAATTANGGHIVLPPGMISFNPSCGFSIPNGTWIQGAGKYITILKIPNANNSTTPMLNINGAAPNNIYISDLTLDGNASNQTNGASLVQVLSNGSKVRVERSVLQNSWSDCFVANSSGSGNFSADIEILGNEFNSCGGHNAAAGDVRIFQPLRVKVNENRFNNSLALASVTFSSQVGAGQVEIGQNHFVGGVGFGVALGGGTIGAQDGNVHDNWFSMGATANQNVIDISYWNNVTIHHNHILAMGTCCVGIADLPPAFRTVADGNEIFGSPSLITNNCIALGGTGTEIHHNFCQGAGGAGITVSIGSTSQTKKVTVDHNIVKNNSQQTSGAHAGIEIFLASGGSASVSDVTIDDNEAYDDQGSPTQGWGIGLAVSGQTTGFSGILTHHNIVRGNKTAAILNSTSGATNMLIEDNPGGETQSLGSPTLAGLTLGSDTSFSASPRNYLTCFIPTVTTSAVSWCNFTLDKPVTFTDFQVRTQTQANCTTSPNFGTGTSFVTLTNAVSTADTGAVSVNQAAGTIALGVLNTDACTTQPANVYLTVEYKMQ